MLVPYICALIRFLDRHLMTKSFENHLSSFIKDNNAGYRGGIAKEEDNQEQVSVRMMT